uniref:Succinate dehydrogenase assembly factor 4, mitochondrial n=1 Tax=Leersia perrieri TaxID=77586 RepID=A0A0D9WM51_9ORYZ
MATASHRLRRVFSPAISRTRTLPPPPFLSRFAFFSTPASPDQAAPAPETEKKKGEGTGDEEKGGDDGARKEEEGEEGGGGEYVNKATGEIGGPRGPEPTRYGDWERGGRCSDF